MYSIVLLTIVSYLHIAITGSLATVPQFVSMDFTTVPEDTAVAQGEKAALQCSATYGNGPPDVYSWERNSVLLSMTSTGNTKLMYNNGSIIFPSVQEGGASPDTGTYRCMAEKIDPSGKVHRIASPEANLVLASVGSIVAQPSDVNALAGDGAMFQCRSNAYPAAAYSWTKDRVAITASDRLLLHGDGMALELLAITSSDTGTYRCTATNKAGSITSNEATLTIKQTAGPERPKFQVRPRDESIEAGKPVALYCAVQGRGDNGNRPTVTWLRQGSTIDIDNSDGHYERLGTGSLLIHNVSKADEGRYTCRAVNSVDVADAEVSVTVLVPPYYVTRPVNTYGRVNGDVELECDIRGYPQPRITWLKNSAEFPPNQYFTIVGGNLRIMGLMPTDAHYYQCVGENSVGKVFSTAQLLVIEEGVQVEADEADSAVNITVVPQAPTNLKLVLKTHDYVSLKWNASAGASGYTVSVVSPTDSTSRKRSANTTSTDHTIQGLQPNTQYLFKVSAFNRIGKSPTSRDLEVTTSAEAAVPGPVRDLGATLVTHNTIELSWDIPLQTNGGIAEYRIYYYSIDQSQESNKSSTSTSVVIENLDPYTEYHIRSVAFNSNGQGMSSEVLTLRTSSAKPSAAPLNVGVEVTGTNSILMRWDPPPPKTINGQLTGYKIKYKVKESAGRAFSHITDADARTYEITGLESGTPYIVRVGAVNINGTGEQSPWLDVSTYTAQLDESRPPGRPLRLQVEPFAREIAVGWIPANDSILVRRYKLGYGTVIPDELWVDLDPSARFTTLTNLQPKTNYVMQLFAWNRIGQGPAIEQQTFTTEEIVIPEERPELLPPVQISTVVLSATSVIVRWHDNTLGHRQKNSDGRVYTVKYSALSGTSHRRPRYENTTHLITTLENLKPYTEYEFSVMLTKDSKTSRYSFTVTNFTMEDAPSTPPEDLTINQIDDETDYLYVSWQPPTQPNGRITNYQIYSNTDSSKPLDEWAVDGVPGDTMNHEFGPVTASTVYYFVITAETSAGASPPSSVVSVRTPDGNGRGGAGFNGAQFDGRRFRHGGKKTTPSGYATGTGGVVYETVPTDPNLMDKYPYLLWIIIACVAVITIIAIAIVLAIICMRRKSTNGSQSKINSRQGRDVNKPAPPDLWIDHERHKLNGRRKHSETDNDTDEMTSMLHSNIDVSASMAGDVPYHDDGRFSSMTRSGRPVIIASNPHREGMPRAAVPPITSDPSRPLYHVNQFAPGGGQFDSSPRVHVGDTSQPSLDSYTLYDDRVGGSFTPPVSLFTRGLTPRDFVVRSADNSPAPTRRKHYHQPHTQHHSHNTAGGSPHSPHHNLATPQSPASSDKRGYSLKNFSRPPLFNTHVPKHIVKPQPTSAFRMTNQMTGSSYHPDSSPQHEMLHGSPPIGSPPGCRESQRRPARQSSQSPNLTMSNQSASREDLKSSMMTQSTEQLSAEMAHLHCIMQDFNAIKTDLEMT